MYVYVLLTQKYIFWAEKNTLNIATTFNAPGCQYEKPDARCRPYTAPPRVFTATMPSAEERVAILKSKAFTAHPLRVLELCRGAGLAN